MPPKDKKAEKGQQKAEEKQKAKVAEDKTFGLKNKNKSKVVQKFIKGVKQQATGGTTKGGESAQLAAEFKAKEEKKKDLQQKALLQALYGAQEKAKNASALDTSKATRQAAKISPYVDRRDVKDVEIMNMSAEQLEAYFDEKARTIASGQKYDIVCRNFIEACENSQYGWFWECPNGGDTCKYKHALPLDYVLKKDIAPAILDDDGGIPLEERVENQRAEVHGGTPVTFESFIAWKKRRAEAAELAKKGTPLSGRDLFTENPDLFEDDEDVVDLEALEDDEDVVDLEALEDDEDVVDLEALEDEALGSDSEAECATNVSDSVL